MITAIITKYLILHKWLIKPFYLAKLPENLIRAIKYLLSQWSTVLRGIFEGDSLSILLFILWVNPLIFLLHKLK